MLQRRVRCLFFYLKLPPPGIAQERVQRLSVLSWSRQIPRQKDYGVYGRA